MAILLRIGKNMENLLLSSQFLPILAMILPIIPVYKFLQQLMDAHGKVEIYERYAILYCGGKHQMIDKDTRIHCEYAYLGPYSSTTKRHPIMKMYSFQQGKTKYHLSTSCKEAHEKVTWKQRRNREEVYLTLDLAINATIMSLNSTYRGVEQCDKLTDGRNLSQ